MNGKNFIFGVLTAMNIKPGIWGHVVQQKGTDISREHAASVHRKCEVNVTS
jgi:hypothetical protein